MALQIIGSNLNTYGNQGGFESDPSTWGFSGGIGGAVSRSSFYQKENAYSLEYTITQANYFGGYNLAIGRATVEIGKIYKLSAWIRIPSSNKLMTSNAYEFQINASTSFIFPPAPTQFNIISQVKKFQGEALATWVQIETIIEVTGGSTTFLPHVGVNSVNTNLSGNIYIDQFEIFEMEDIVFSCNLLADGANINITDETVALASDGTISMAVTGAQGSVLYRIDMGNWQSSSLFSGLAAGSHTVYVRETLQPSCEVIYNFVIAPFGSFPISIESFDETIKGKNDGSIIITPNGGVSPHEYSITGGAPYQLSNSFTNLPPGSYAVVVLDDDLWMGVANVVIAEGESIFDSIDFSKNKIIAIRSQTSNSFQYSYRIYNEVNIESPAGSNDFVKKIALELEPEYTGAATFELQSAFKAIFDPQPPVYNLSEITKITDRSAIYKSAFGDLFNDLEVPAALTDTGISLAIYGGVSNKAFPTLKYFSEYLANNAKFMTWLPYEITIDQAQEFYLQYFVSKFNTTIRMMADIYYDDQTSDLSQSLATKSGVSFADLYVIPAGATQSGVLAVDPAKNVIKYDIYLVDEVSIALTDKFTFNISQFYFPNTRYFMYINSLGAHEVLRCTGIGSTSSKFSKTTMLQHLSTDYDALTPQVESFNSSFQDSHEYSTGYIDGDKALEYLQALRDILLTSRFYDITSGKRVPLIVVSDSMKISQDEDYSYYLRFKCSTPYIDHSYTPSAL